MTIRFFSDVAINNIHASILGWLIPSKLGIPFQSLLAASAKSMV